MALIHCVDCNREISSTAPSCIHCGRQMVATTIERTGKSIKAAQLMGCTAVIVGTAIVVAGCWTSPAVVVVGFSIIFSGSITTFGASIVRWWRHG